MKIMKISLILDKKKRSPPANTSPYKYLYKN